MQVIHCEALGQSPKQTQHCELWVLESTTMYIEGCGLHTPRTIQPTQDDVSRMRSVHYRLQNVPAFPKPWWGMQFGEHRAKKQGHTNAICFRSGCDPQTHWDDTTHSRCRAIHMRSSSKTPGRTSPPRSFGGTCHLEKAELKNKVTQTPSALDTGVTHRHTGTIQLTQGDVPCM